MSDPETWRTRNETLLREVTASGSWFHARKTRPIRVRRLEQETTVKTLEGVERVPAGTWLCRGEAGDIWPQSEQGLNARYNILPEVDGDGWHRCEPRSDAAGVMAARVPHAFQVQARWGVLNGKAGDFLVKNFADRDNDHPDDVWIVDQNLFEATYQRSSP